MIGMMIEREYFHRRIDRTCVWIVKCVIVIVIVIAMWRAGLGGWVGLGFGVGRRTMGLGEERLKEV